MVFELNIFYILGAVLLVGGIVGFIVVKATSSVSKKKMVEKLNKEY